MQLSYTGHFSHNNKVCISAMHFLQIHITYVKWLIIMAFQMIFNSYHNIYSYINMHFGVSSFSGTQCKKSIPSQLNISCSAWNVSADLQLPRPNLQRAKNVCQNHVEHDSLHMISYWLATASQICWFLIRDSESLVVMFMTFIQCHKLILAIH